MAESTLLGVIGKTGEQTEYSFVLRVLTFDEALTIVFPSSYHSPAMSSSVIITRFNHHGVLAHCPLLDFCNFVICKPNRLVGD